MPDPGRRVLRLGPLARASAFVLLVQLGGAVLLFGQQLVLARWMGITEYGGYAYLVAWATILAVVVAAGLPTLSLRYAAAYRAAGDRQRLAGIVRFARRLLVAFGIGALAAAASLGIIAAALGFDLALPALAVVVMAILVALSQLQLDLARTIARSGLAYLPSFVVRPIAIVAACGLVLLLSGALDAGGAIAATIAAIGLVVLGQGLILDRALASITGGAQPRLEPRVWLGVAAPLLIINVCVAALPNLATLVLGAVRGPEAAGIYSVASRSAALTAFGLLAVNALVTPTYAVLHATGEGEGMRALAARASHLIFWPSLALGLALIAFADPLARAFGTGFDEARWPLVILVLGQLVNAGAGTVGGLMSMTGHQATSARVYTVVLLLALALDLVGGILAGAVGAAAGTALSLALLNVWLRAFVMRRLGLDPSILAGIAMLRRARSRPAVEPGSR